MKYWSKSWNTVYGCTKIRAGCLHCWAEIMCRRMQGNGLLNDVVDADGNWTGKIVYKRERVSLPYCWHKPQIVAVNWMGDMFHPNVPPEVWPMTYRVMATTPHHKYLVLTKRYFEMTFGITGKPFPNIYMGVTISCRQDAATAMAPLRILSDKGWKTWVSFEPVLEEVMWVGFEWLNGMVCGGESGRNARPMPIQAAYGARDYCRLYKIPFTFKQGSQGAPAVLDGATWFQFPNGGDVK